ncbi:Uncharacterised protein [Raoultella terrigena]|uniref:Uncharacterized protein n=1 Tax=Raoultella terrigena TaxID=577 RepID=A0A4U9D939_RAOTE|nr:Uncharacterised protein [Raoultella terrigena]
MGVTAGTDGVRQQHTVQPRVDNAIARTQRDAAAVHNEVRQSMVRGHVDRLRIGRGMAEGLHHQVRREAQARQVFQLVTGHRTGGILGANGGHLRLTVGARTNTGYATGAANHFLRQRVAAGAFGNVFRLTEGRAVRQTQGVARASRQATTDNQRNTATGADFIDQYVGFQLEGRQQRIGFVVTHFAFERVNVDNVAHIQVVDVNFNR